MSWVNAFTRARFEEKTHHESTSPRVLVGRLEEGLQLVTVQTLDRAIRRALRWGEAGGLARLAEEVLGLIVGVVPAREEPGERLDVGLAVVRVGHFGPRGGFVVAFSLRSLRAERPQIQPRITAGPYSLPAGFRSPALLRIARLSYKYTDRWRSLSPCTWPGKNTVLQPNPFSEFASCRSRLSRTERVGAKQQMSAENRSRSIAGVVRPGE